MASNGTGGLVVWAIFVTAVPIAIYASVPRSSADGPWVRAGFVTAGPEDPMVLQCAARRAAVPEDVRRELPDAVLAWVHGRGHGRAARTGEEWLRAMTSFVEHEWLQGAGVEGALRDNVAFCVAALSDADPLRKDAIDWLAGRADAPGNDLRLLLLATLGDADLAHLPGDPARLRIAALDGARCVANPGPPGASDGDEPVLARAIALSRALPSALVEGAPPPSTAVVRKVSSAEGPAWFVTFPGGVRCDAASPRASTLALVDGYGLVDVVGLGEGVLVAADDDARDPSLSPGAVRLSYETRGGTGTETVTFGVVEGRAAWAPPR